MMNNKKRKIERMRSGEADSIGISTYNLIIGALLVYGFIANAIMVAFLEDFAMSINPVVLIVGYFISVIVGTIMSVKSTNPIISFVGYNLIVLPIGLLLAIVVPMFSSGDVMAAMVTTGIVSILMTVAATLMPKLFAGMGRSLFISLILGIIVELIATFVFGYSGDIFNWFFVIIFSCYIGFDWCKAQEYPKTIDNAVDSAIDIYLDIINIFIRLLEIFGRSRD